MEVAMPFESLAQQVVVEVDAGSTVNYAMHQNDVAVVRRLRIQNNEDYDIDGVTLSIAAEPEFAHPWKRNIERLPAQSTYDVGIVDVPLAPNFLAAQTEAVRGYLNICLHQGDHVIAEERVSMEVLAYDQWNGLRTLPELLAAFVMPNHPIVEQILRQAANVLETWTGDSSLSGYQSQDPERVRLQAAAIYEAIKQQGIAYSGVPASFEEMGQKVRTPDRILEARLGNCLDLSALFAACLEQAGLHPLICIIEGHAFPGVWLMEDGFPDPAVDDAAAITKRVALGEMSIFEATLVTGGNNSFDTAQDTARDHLKTPEVFIYAIDIHRARSSRIRPIPMRVNSTGAPIEDTPTTPTSPSQASAPDPGTTRAQSSGEMQEKQPMSDTAENGKAPATNNRLDQWKRKLLDLSMRNALLNFRETKRTVPLLSTNLDDVENALAEGRKLAIHPKPADWDESERDPELFRERTGQEAGRDLLLAEFEQGRLRAALSETELQRRLIEIYRTARSSLEENGANTLYLSLGYLAWYETNGENAPKRLAPLLLIPIEIQRKSVQAPFTIELRDDDAEFNVTLLEMLRSNFDLDIPGLEPLPRDEAGIDVALVLRKVRQAIKHMPRWDVEETAYVGLFSFTKFLMWRDLVSRTEELKRNKLVASLINFPHQPLPVSSNMPDPDKLDELYKPADTFCPLSADSSQLAAVHAAAEGNTFVLHGPPGTGKSQTITNMIAQALGQGKTVLFVAEKIAALDVVQRRLAENGLGEFCLELHSNKSKKADVVRQFGETLQLAQTMEPAEWALEADRLARLRDELNTYVQALHERRQSGDSFHIGLSRLIQHRRAKRVKFDRTWAAGATPESLAAWRDQVRALVQAGRGVGHPANHVWSGAQVMEWSADLRDDVQASVDQARSIIPELAEAAVPVAELFGLSTDSWSRLELDVLCELVELVLSRSQISPALVGAQDWDDVQSALETWIRDGQERDALRGQLYDQFTDRLIELDLERMVSDRAVAKQSWFLPKWLTQRRIHKQLKSVAKPGKKVSVTTIDETISLAIQLRETENALATAGDRARSLLGRLWADGEADWDAVRTAWDWASSVRQLAAKLAGPDLALRQDLRHRWSNLFSEATDAFGEDGAYTAYLRHFRDLATRFKEQIGHLTTLLDLSPESAWVSGLNDNYLEALEATLVSWGERINDLRLWCTWQKERAQAMAEGLSPLVAEYETGLPHDQVLTCFERSYYESWVDVVMGEDEMLRSFSRHSHEDKIREFQELDDRFRELTKQVLRARLLANVPPQVGTPNENSEMGILRREVQKQIRHMPIRALFNRIPNLLTRLKPCLLMSPISVAQYLDASFPPFDLVIFDEASQIPTWDAVGAIARGTEAIIVGDPKQLPPTNFFNRADSADDDHYEEGAVEDLESILDDCLSLSINQLYLRWHYRSRNESLIAFSNSEYYNNELLTFPSPESEPSVRLRNVNGVYDRGRSRTNRTEADAVVQEVIRRLTDPEQANRSIGVVTFSQAQQRLIEDLLDEACRKHPEIEPFFDSDKLEPVFVKNLENVQGDERDVILFSIGYGPDSVGRMSMNFGPLNRAGGERRLNVAITRARYEVEVFSSFVPEQLDLSRTQQKGVRDLKTFLEFAQRGPIALDRQVLVSGDAETESPFEQDVMEALLERGYRVLAQVGCSGYRIDLAVVDPDNPGRFVLGIECDGAMYHGAKNARDRDKLREAVLRGLGWEIHHIWSTDWWHNRSAEIERLEAAIEAALLRADEDPAPVETKAEMKIANAPVVVKHDAPPEVEVVSPVTLPTYEMSTAAPDAYATQIDFYSDAATQAICTLTEQIVADEGPISLNLLARRVASWWDLQRMTARLQSRMEAVVDLANVKAVTRDGVTFVWPPGLELEDYDTFRLPGEGPARRDAEDVPPEEIASAMLHILRSQISLPRADLVREVARLLGYQRTGPVIERCMLAGLELLEDRGTVHEVNGMVVEV